MKNINKFLAVYVVAFLAVLSACEDEVLVPVEDNTAVEELLASITSLENELFEYNLEKRTVTLLNRKLEQTLDSLETAHTDLRHNGNKVTEVQYTVNVISSANYVQGRTAGLTGATVTVQQGSYKETRETDSGLAVFKGLKEGEAIVIVSAPEYTKAEMVVHFLSDGAYSNNADYYNASTQVLLFPVSGKNSATVKGNVYANTSTINDTLNRMYGYNSVYGDKVGKFVAKPGIFPSSENFTQQSVWNNKMIGNPYFNYYDPYNYYSYYIPSGEAVQFENVPASTKLYAVARPSFSLQPDFMSSENAGYIKSITYTNLISEVVINTDHSYSVEVPASAGTHFMIEFYATELVADHTRFTVPLENSGPGTSFEAGAEKVSFKYYNSTDHIRENQGSVQEDGTLAYPLIEPNQSATLSLYTITEPFRYELRGNHFLNSHIHPGQVKFNNLYFWPVSRP